MSTATSTEPLSELIATIPIIDVDSHISEPPDLWTSRMSTKRWGNLVPHVRRADTGEDFWYLGDRRLMGVGSAAIAGWKDFFPAHPPTLDDADPGSYDPHARLQRLDEYGVHAQLLYPNVLGTFSGAFLALNEPELMLDCVRAYNDFCTDFASADPSRLIPLTMVPFWDIEASQREIERCAEMGHRGVVMAAHFTAVGYPDLASGHWDAMFDTAQSLGQSINFHIGFSQLSDDDMVKATSGFDHRNFTRDSVLMFVGNVSTITDIILSGLCDRFPRLPFVSVESGAGYLPYLLEAMDWQWRNSGCVTRYPGSVLPSEVFRRQVYGTWWFEENTLSSIVDLADNIMFETDYPHPTSLSPGPASFADVPRDSATRSLSGLPEDVVRKVLHDTAARLYRLP